MAWYIECPRGSQLAYEKVLRHDGSCVARIHVELLIEAEWPEGDGCLEVETRLTAALRGELSALSEEEEEEGDRVLHALYEVARIRGML